MAGPIGDSMIDLSRMRLEIRLYSFIWNNAKVDDGTRRWYQAVAEFHGTAITSGEGITIAEAIGCLESELQEKDKEQAGVIP